MRLSGEADLAWFPGPLKLTIRLDGGGARELPVTADGPFAVELPLPKGRLGPVVIEVIADRWYIPHWFRRNRDFRPLAWRYCGLAPLPGAAAKP